ncbi:hypothetical protein H696_00443 [Fonticula alba]|uniref:Transcription elongation factor SPT5 n=1 Tax=Fonticula alba TaxID=691883 RepID=A0A058ZFZ2_FONAL|nr:hypothetical protein H696_00443 [Fonticula alba]KCV72871.1 hypothetical protein H696_00443 [Fonticula alba]|eukprot:XP_009492572.1 hypothetical protein H696_00443 [Fonticula alba]
MARSSHSRSYGDADRERRSSAYDSDGGEDDDYRSAGEEDDLDDDYSPRRGSSSGGSSSRKSKRRDRARDDYDDQDDDYSDDDAEEDYEEDQHRRPRKSRRTTSASLFEEDVEEADEDYESDGDLSEEDYEESRRASRKSSSKTSSSRRKSSSRESGSSAVDKASSKKKKKSGKSRTSSLFDDAADVGDSDEEDEDYYSDEPEEGLYDAAAEAEQRASAAAARQLNRDHMRRDYDNSQMTIRRLESSYGRHDAEDYVVSDSEDTGDTLLSRLPVASNKRQPKLWKVPCMRGKEFLACRQLTVKSIAFGSDDFVIYSAVATERGCGYIYVEGYTSQAVKTACEDISSLLVRRVNQVEMVPVSDMTQVLETKPIENTELAPNDFVRIRSGHHRGDLAQVIRADDNSLRVHVKLVPRIDYSNLARDRPAKDAKREQFRPPLRFFDPEEIRKHGHHIRKTEDDRYEFAGEYYSSKGLLLKIFNTKNLITRDVKPTLDEREWFLKAEKGEITSKELASLSSTTGDSGSDTIQIAAKNLRIGDPIIVLRGDLRNATGYVETIESSGAVAVRLEVTSMAGVESVASAIGMSIVRGKSGQKLIRTKFVANQLQKFFRSGDKVKVIRGGHNNQTGIVLDVQGDIARITTDIQRTEIEVFTRDLTLTNETSTSLSSAGRFRHLDMVLLDGTTAAVVLAVDGQHLRVIDHRGVSRSVAESDVVATTSNTKKFARDINGGRISVRSQVRVLEGPNKDRQASVLHIFNQAIFLVANDIRVNSGVFTAYQNQVQLIQDTSFRPPVPTGPPGMMAPGLGVPGMMMGGGGGMSGGDPFRGRRDPLLNQQVTIVGGLHKGAVATIRRVLPQGDRVRVFIPSKRLEVELPRSSIQQGQQVRPGGQQVSGIVLPFPGQAQGYGAGRYGGGATPSYGGGATPSYGGGATPSYSSHAPMYGAGAGGPGGGTTPSYGAPTDYYRSSAPGAGAGGGSAYPGVGGGPAYPGPGGSSAYPGASGYGAGSASRPPGGAPYRH